MPTLVLDKFNSGYKTELHVVPRVSSIKKPELFTEDPGYHGEIVEFYANYMERVDSLTGIAVSGWSNTAARKIFSSVEKTFETKSRKRKCESLELEEELEKKMEGSSSDQTSASKNVPRDFEIDWILFNGSTITVVEVGEQGCSEKGSDSATNATEWKKRHKIVPKKIKQIEKDQVIMNQFLTAVGAPEVTVNYLLVYPNLPLLEIEKELSRCGFFEKAKKWKPLVNYSTKEARNTGNSFLVKFVYFGCKGVLPD